MTVYRPRDNRSVADDITILSLEDREQWNAQVDAHGLPSQSWTYAQGLAASGYAPRLAVVRSGAGRLLIPFFERAWHGATDIATIPGLSGASVAPGSGAALSLWREFAAAQGWVAGYIQLAVTAELQGTREEHEIAVHNTLFVFDLASWNRYDSVSRKFRQTKLYEGRRLDAVLETDRERLAEALVRLYPQAMQRLGGKVEFSAETLRRWTHDADAVVLGAQLDGEIVGVHLGRALGGHADWHIAAMSERGRSLGAWLVWSAMEPLKDRGVRWFNIGGGGRVGDSIYQYKQRFNATPMPLRSLRQVYDQRRYAELCASAGADAGNGWFPAYRKARNASAAAPANGVA